MKKRPLLFVILGVLHILLPFFNLFFLKVKTGLEWNVVIDNVLSMQGFKNIFDFWFIFPIAGLALFSVKAWTYPLFVGVQAYSLYNHLFYEKFTWPYVSERPYAAPIFLIIVNIAIMIYFALPAVRRPFFDRRMRLWEVKPRYGSDIACFISILGHEQNFKSKILNISESGAFIEMRPGLDIQKDIRANFEFYDHHFSLTARVMNRHVVNGIHGMGIQFVFTSWSERYQLKKFIKRLTKTFKNSLENKNSSSNLAA